MGRLSILKQIAEDIAIQFGSDCEVVIHDLKSKEPESSIVYIVNGHVTGRSVGDGPSNAVFEAIRRQNKGKGIPEDHAGYLMKTVDGKILKCSTSYIQDDDGSLHYVFSINFDITRLTMIDSAIQTLISSQPAKEASKETAPRNVNDLLDQLIEESVRLVGKPVALMNKEDKVKAIQFLNDSGAFLITKSGDKVSSYFGISKYTLYSYIDVNK